MSVPDMEASDSKPSGAIEPSGSASLESGSAPAESSGSRIVEINGERGDCKRLTSLLQSGYELNVLLIPKSALTPLHELLAMEREK